IRTEIRERYGTEVPQELEPAQNRLRRLEMVKANCERLVAAEETLAELEPLKAAVAWALPDEPEIAAAAKTVPVPAVYAIAAIAPPSSNVALVHASASHVADNVKTIFTDNKYAYLIDFSVNNPDCITDGDIRKFVDGFRAGYNTDLAEL